MKENISKCDLWKHLKLLYIFWKNCNSFKGNKQKTDVLVDIWQVIFYIKSTY